MCSAYSSSPCGAKTRVGVCEFAIVIHTAAILQMQIMKGRGREEREVSFAQSEATWHLNSIIFGKY